MSEKMQIFIEYMNEGKIKYENGRLWRYFHGYSGWLKEPNLINGKTKDGYRDVNIQVNNKVYYVKEHRLIWSYFNGDIPEGMTINHIDGNKTNNSLDNLELVTPEENNEHAFQTGLNSRKLTINQIKELKSLIDTGVMSKRAIAKKFGVSDSTVQKVSKGLRYANI
jgi:hypothetical protein